VSGTSFLMRFFIPRIPLGSTLFAPYFRFGVYPAFPPRFPCGGWLDALPRSCCFSPCAQREENMAFDCVLSLLFVLWLRTYTSVFIFFVSLGDLSRYSGLLFDGRTIPGDFPDLKKVSRDFFFLIGMQRGPPPPMGAPVEFFPQHPLPPILHPFLLLVHFLCFSLSSFRRWKPGPTCSVALRA